jgi:tetratricopeptide (TPR) repeat protein
MFRLCALLLLAAGGALAAGTRAEADALFQAGRYQQAAESYLALLRESPRDPGLLEAMGQTLRQMGQPQAAIPFFQHEVELSPMSRSGLHSLAAALQEANVLEEGQRLLNQLTAADPNDAESWYRLGLLSYQNGYYTAAIEDLDRFLKLNPDDGTRQYRNRAEIVRAISLVEAGRLGEARAAIPALLALPGNAANLDLLLGYARLLYEDGHYAEAMKQADLAAAAGPTNASAHFWRARILQQQGQVPQATAEAERARELSPDSPAPRSLLVRLYQKSGRTAEAEKEAAWLRLRETQAATP